MENEVWSLLWKVINVVILIGLLYKLLAGRVRTFFENRRMLIKKEMEEAEMLRKEAERRYEELKQKLANIDKEIEELKELYRNEGLAEKERIIESAKKEAQKIRQGAVRTIEQEAARARSMIRREYAEMVIDMAEKEINKKLTGKDQDRILQEYIEKVVKLN